MPDYDAHQVAGIQRGEVLAGKYRVERILGAGGMGVVVAAHHLTLDEKVAIKFLRPEMLEDSASLHRFLREARAAVKIKSEHVARVFDVGTLENGAPYIVMEFLEGEDLASWLRQRGPLPVEQTVEFVLQACVAVAEAHRLGIVHRDLKPANLFCVRRADGRLGVKVLDFGISKMTGGVSGFDTGPAALLGSPFYMAPEQMRATTTVDAGTDVWALGVILYELLTGKVPFYGHTIAEVAAKVSLEPPPPLRQLRASIPAGLESVVVRCLAKDRSGRFPNVAALANALKEFGPRGAAAYAERIAGTLDPTSPSGNGWVEPGPPPASASSASSDPRWHAGGTIAPMGRTVPRGITSKTGVAALVAALVGGIAIGAVLMARGPVTVRVSGDSGSVTAWPPPPVVSVSGPAPTKDDTALTAAPSTPLAKGPAPVPTLAPAPLAPAPVAPTTAPRAKPQVPATPRPTAATTATTPPTLPPTTTGANNCRLVSYFDSEGNQHFKEDCSGN
jgi:eukaryotic-like serine/threonine-protein kinase